MYRLSNDYRCTQKIHNDPAAILEVQVGSGAAPAVFGADASFADAGIGDC
jgi:hypothetical protein